MLQVYVQNSGMRQSERFHGWAGRLALFIGALICFTHGTRAQVTNGDFSSGNTGFTSNYDYTTSSAPAFTAGDYTIGTNPNSYNAGWVNMGDHTTGTGSMMIVNGSSPSVISPVWEETVTVTPDTTYTFTAWVADIYGLGNDPSPETLTFQVGSNILGSGFSASTTSGTWTEFTDTYFSGSDTSETLEIIDTNTGFEGNDFALDDISYSPTPEPASMLLFGTGVLGIAGFLRRASSSRRT
jgi:hypothetical protein